MRERPILFSAPMVRALLEGRKTQTRRVVKPQPEAYADGAGFAWGKKCGGGIEWMAKWCPYGVPGDRLWVRETFSISTSVPISQMKGPLARRHLWFWADGNPEDGDWTRPKPSIFLPRWGSRLLLEITEVRVERLQAITNVESQAEGVTHWKCGHPDCFDERGTPGMHFGPRAAYMELWDSLNEKRGYGWDANPWVWVLEFKRVPQ